MVWCSPLNQPQNKGLFAIQRGEKKMQRKLARELNLYQNVELNKTLDSRGSRWGMQKFMHDFHTKLRAVRERVVEEQYS
jgi:hypothetical protein